jgi:acyl-CoA reductase-like NAD-dependent aldehyde dehydrogenase
MAVRLFSLCMTHEMPFGGFTEGGLGGERDRPGLREYTEVKSIAVSIG